MKKVILVTALFFSCFAASAQFTYKIKADSLLVTNDSCTAELNLENKTKNVPGFLWNKGRGRTEFKRALQMVDSVTYLIGEDTLRVGGGSSVNAWKLSGNAGTNANHFLGTTDSIDLVIKTKAIENGRFRASGGMVFKNTAGLDKIDINKNGTGYLSINHRFGQGENNHFTTPLDVVAVMDSASKKGRGTLISATRDFKSANGVTINPSTLEGNSIKGHTNLRMKKGSYNFYSDATTGFPTSSILANMDIASQDGSDSVTRYTFYGTFGGATTGLSNVTARMDFSWAKPSDNYGMYNSYLSVPLFSGQVGRYTEWFNHYAAAFTYKGGANGKVGTVTGLYIENLKQDSVNRAWGILQLGVNDLNGFKGKVMIGDTTVSNFGSNNLYVVGNGKFTDTLTATTMAVTDSSDRVATTKWVKQQGFGSGSSGGSGNGWSLTGNAGTDPANNFLGTTNAGRLAFRTDNTERAVINHLGDVGIGTASPTAKLHLYGNNPHLFIEGDANSYYTTVTLKSVNGSGAITNYGVNGTGGINLQASTSIGGINIGANPNGVISYTTDSTLVTHRIIGAQKQMNDIFRVSKNVSAAPGVIAEEPSFVVNKDGNLWSNGSMQFSYLGSFSPHLRLGYVNGSFLGGDGKGVIYISNGPGGGVATAAPIMKVDNVTYGGFGGIIDLQSSSPYNYDAGNTGFGSALRYIKTAANGLGLPNFGGLYVDHQVHVNSSLEMLYTNYAKTRVGGNSGYAYYADAGTIAGGNGTAYAFYANAGQSYLKDRLILDGPNGYSQLRLAKSYTPSSSSDTNGQTGEMAWDDNYIYIKTTAGWKRTSLSSF